MIIHQIHDMIQRTNQQINVINWDIHNAPKLNYALPPTSRLAIHLGPHKHYNIRTEITIN